jgi:hypothetical protein
MLQPFDAHTQCGEEKNKRSGFPDSQTLILYPMSPARSSFVAKLPKILRHATKFLAVSNSLDRSLPRFGSGYTPVRNAQQ